MITEQLRTSKEQPPSVALRETMAGIDSLPQFRALLLGILEKPSIQLRDVPVEPFLDDFGAQIELRELFQAYGPHTVSGIADTPVLILKKDIERRADGNILLGGTSTAEPHRFRLNDPDHIYYFSQHSMAEPAIVLYQRMDAESEVPPPHVQHDLVTLHRVPVIGGPAEFYSHGTQLWEPNGMGTFKGVNVGNGNRGGVFSLGDRIDTLQKKFGPDDR